MVRVPTSQKQLTSLQRQGRRDDSKPLALQQGSKRINPDELTQVSDSGA
ncbi:addiction module toxin RelE [Yersinia enterocolitica]|nr:addiction module toxin RelE [Yersinia enterocolitica]EKN6189353.1 addiction module toxin RelE [Yersinia enterocolitica]EKN6324950.1 addiction module toxin RelE [Yersinia enterocolitica]